MPPVSQAVMFLSFLFLKDFIYFLERREGREKERERNNHWLPFACLQPGTWATTQARGLTGNRTDDVQFAGQCPTHRAMLGQLCVSHCLSPTTLWSRYDYYHFVDKETERLRKNSRLYKATGIASIKMSTKLAWTGTAESQRQIARSI